MKIIHVIKKKAVRNRIVTLILCVVLISSGRSAEIVGKISLEEGWRPVVYLSQLNSFDDLNTASFHLLIAEAEVDGEGNFSFASLNIPTYDQLYRLHICKENDPVSTIIIGGQEQNHLHFLMNSSSTLSLDITSFHDFSLNGHTGNTILQELFELKNRINAPLDIPSDQNRRLHKDHIRDQFIRIAEGTTSDVNRLLSMHFLRKNFDKADFAMLYETLPKQLNNDNDSSPYYAAFIAQAKFFQFNNENGNSKNASFPWYYLLLIPIAAFIYYAVNSRQKVQADPVGILSIQEKKVYELLCTGKSNKEISSILHIEVSTVKSHVYKIFSKLGVKSRKELFT